MREGELHQWGYTKMDGFFHGLFEHRINRWMISGYPYDLGNLYPLVICYIAIENGHL